MILANNEDTSARMQQAIIFLLEDITLISKGRLGIKTTYTEKLVYLKDMKMQLQALDELYKELENNIYKLNN